MWFVARVASPAARSSDHCLLVKPLDGIIIAISGIQFFVLSYGFPERTATAEYFSAGLLHLDVPRGCPVILGDEEYLDLSIFIVITIDRITA